MRYTTLFVAILIALADTVAYADDSTNIIPNTNLSPESSLIQSYVLSTGAYKTRCRWAKSGGSGTNRGEDNCKIKTVSDRLCAPGYTVSVSVSAGGGDFQYGNAIIDQPIISVNSSNQYNLAFWNGTNYLTAKVTTTGMDDMFVIVSYVVYCTKGTTTKIYPTDTSLKSP